MFCFNLQKYDGPQAKLCKKEVVDEAYLRRGNSVYSRLLVLYTHFVYLCLSFLKMAFYRRYPEVPCCN